MRLISICAFFFLLGTIPMSLKAQGPVHKVAYTIDPAIQKVIAKKKFDGLFAASLDIEWMENGKDAGFPLSGKDNPTMAGLFVQSDTNIITLMPGFTPGAMLLIQLVKDSAIVTHIISPRDAAPSFKLLPTDSLMRSISVPPKKVKLLLAGSPMPNKPIEGHIEFESVVFYQKDATGFMERTYKAAGYFKVEKM